MTETQPAKILIADDEPLYLRTTGDLLRKAGYECDCVVELRNVVERSLALARADQVQTSDLPPVLQSPAQNGPGDCGNSNASRIEALDDSDYWFPRPKMTMVAIPC